MIKHSDQYSIDEFKRFVICSETTGYINNNTLRFKVIKFKSVSHIKVKGAYIVMGCPLHI